MDLFDWSQLPGQLENEELSAGFENLFVPEDNETTLLGWTDYLLTPDVRMMTYSEASKC